MSILFANLFQGTVATPWPAFTWPEGNPSFSVPVVDGQSHGMASRSAALLWRGRSSYYPGRSNYEAELSGRWKNPSGSTRWCGLILRFKDWDNLYSLRLSSTVGGAPVLHLVQRIGGVETSLGTYGGVGVADMLAGTAWTGRAIDETDGSTSITAIYKDIDVITWNGTNAVLRGPFTCGVEFGPNVKSDDILIGPLVCSSSITETEPSVDYGLGWVVEIGDTVYTTTELRSEGLDLLNVVKQFGQSGCTATFEIQGDFVESDVLFPGQLVKVYHDGYTRFDGYVSENPRQGTPGERQQVMCRDGMWRSRQVYLREDDLTSTHYFNVYDSSSEHWRVDRQNMTIGDIIKFLFDRYETELRFYGAFGGYVLNQLSQMTAVIPDISVRGVFLSAILSLLKFAPDHDVFVEPIGKIWTFRDLTSMQSIDLSLTTDHIHVNIKPSREDCYSFVEIIGGVREDAPEQWLKLSDGSLREASTDEQKNLHTKDKEALANLNTSVLGTGTVTDTTSQYWGLDYIDIPAADAPDNGDFRGAVIQIQGHLRLVANNEGARFYLSPPNWSSPPPNGTPITFSLTSEDALTALSALGVGRGFIAPALADICPTSNQKGGLKNQGWCGQAQVTTTDPVTGQSFAQEYAFSVQYNALKLSMGGTCDAMVMLAAPAKPPVGLMNTMPPGGSVTKSACEPGAPTLKDHSVEVEINLSQFADRAAYIREPEIGYYGESYSEDPTTWEGGGEPLPSDWAVRQRLVLNVPDFVDEDIQGPGLREWAKALLSVYSRKQYLFDLDIATPWVSVGPTRPGYATTSKYSDLDFQVTLSSAKRVTKFENADNLPGYKVLWDVKGNKTKLTVGTVGGWKRPDAASLQRIYTDKHALEKAAVMIQSLENFRNSLIKKTGKQVQTPQRGKVDGCEVIVINKNLRTVRNVQQDDEKKHSWLNHTGLVSKGIDAMVSGPSTQHPGGEPAAPGYTQGLLPFGSAVLGGAVPYDVPNPAPDSSVPNADSGRWQGHLETDHAEAGSPGVILFKRGNVAFRKAGDTPDAAFKVEFSPLDGEGQPTGAWQPFETNIDLWDAGINPRDALNSRSILSDHEDTIQANLEAVLRQETDDGRPALPGDITSAAPDGVPADLKDHVFSPTNDTHFRTKTKTDVGGTVFEGPMNDFGANAGMYWRWDPSLGELVQVEEVAAGTGTNGGDWANAEPQDGVVEALTGGRVEHKQIHLSELHESEATPGTTSVPHGTNSPNAYPETLALGVGAEAGAVIALPNGSVGTPLIQGTTMEIVNAPSYILEWRVQYKASAWGSPSAPTTENLSGDGSGTATGKFMGPGDSVPPGLRKPFGPGGLMIVSVKNAGTAPIGLSGLAVEIAVIEGGAIVYIKEGVTVAEDVQAMMGEIVDTVAVSSVWSREITKNREATVEILEDWFVEVNPPVSFGETVLVSEEWTVESI